jgi:hypothetical protein
MAKIRHGGGSRTVVFWPFWEVVRWFVFFGGDDRERVFLGVRVFLGSMVAR